MGIVTTLIDKKMHTGESEGPNKSTIGVTTNEGQTAFTRIPCLAY